MAKAPFDRDAMAKWYANQHLRTDPGVRKIYYLRKGAPDREIRFAEVNLERLAPALAQNGPNLEYPWPHEAHAEYPARHQFALWAQLMHTGLGRRLLAFVEAAVDRFPAYG
jgi:hypothetical protein